MLAGFTAGPRSDPLPEIARNIAARNNVLFFDEFQVTDVADAMMMQRLFSSLFANNVTVISTSNRCLLPSYLTTTSTATASSATASSPSSTS